MTPSHRINIEGDTVFIDFAPDTELSPAMAIATVKAEYQLIGPEVRYALWDLRNCSLHPDFSSLALDSSMASVGSAVADRGISMRVAIVFDPLRHGHLVRMIRDMATALPNTVHSSYSREEAKAWLRADTESVIKDD